MSCLQKNENGTGTFILSGDKKKAHAHYLEMQM
jgi:hypothetical protein